MEKTAIDESVGHIHVLLGEKLGAKGRTLETRVRRAGRSLPRPVRNAAQDLVSAEQMSREPKMLMRLDTDQVSHSYTTCVEHLDSIDEKARKSQERFSLAATLIMQICLVMAVLLTVLRWRGFL